MSAHGAAQTGDGALRSPRLAMALVFGVAGTLVLLALMGWQLQRLARKQALIAEIEARLSESPTALPDHPDAARDEFLRVQVQGRFTSEVGTHGFTDAAYLTSLRPHGAGYRIVQPFRTDAGRLILVDRGYVPLAEKNEGGRAARPTPFSDDALTLQGALRWPQPGDFFSDDRAGPADNVWLTRSLDRLAPLWGAEAVLLVAENATAPERWPTPLPVTVDLPNNHLEYAITWGLLAAVWAAMTVALVMRERRR